MGSILPDPILGKLDYRAWTRRAETDAPFNGQIQRERMIQDLIHRVDFEGVVETGTFRGRTTRALAELFPTVQVHTAEAFPRFYFFAQSRLRSICNVRMHLGDSADVLRHLAECSVVPKERVLFYLDAHSSALPGVADSADELPLDRELLEIVSNWSDVVVLIDDFKVPDDDGYGYDVYRGRAIDLQFVEAVVGTSRFDCYFPATPSMEETGARRGSLVMVSKGELSNRVARSPWLRPGVGGDSHMSHSPP